MDYDDEAAYSAEDEEISDECMSDDEGITMDNAAGSAEQDGVQQDYQVLAPEQILVEMKKITDDVKDVISYPSTICRILLHYHKWNKESLLEKYVIYKK